MRITQARQHVPETTHPGDGDAVKYEQVVGVGSFLRVDHRDRFDRQTMASFAEKLGKAIGCRNRPMTALLTGPISIPSVHLLEGRAIPLA